MSHTKFYIVKKVSNTKHKSRVYFVVFLRFRDKIFSAIVPARNADKLLPSDFGILSYFCRNPAGRRACGGTGSFAEHPNFIQHNDSDTPIKIYLELQGAGRPFPAGLS